MTSCNTLVTEPTSGTVLALDASNAATLSTGNDGVSEDHRYSTFKYNEGKYGPSCFLEQALLFWGVIVDWDDDGYFTGENEADRMVSLNVTRGRDNFISPDGNGFERYQTGRATIVLDNDDGRYNPFNTSSDLYPNISPGKNARILVRDSSTGTSYNVMYGKVVDIQPYNEGARKYVKIEIADGQEFLRGRTIKVGYRQNSGTQVDNTYTTGRWANMILEAAGWPDEWQRDYSPLTDSQSLSPSFDPSTYNYLYPFTQLKYAWFWLRDALDAMRELENAELGTFLHDQDGKAQFFSRGFTYDQIIQIDESQIYRDITTPMPWETIRNRVEIGVHQIKFEDLSSAQVLFQIGGDDDDAITIAAGGSFLTDVEFRFGSYKVLPSNHSFSTTFTDADDGGSALSHAASIPSEPDLDDYDIFHYGRGDGATIVVNNTDVSTGYLRNLQLQGDAIYAKFTNTANAETGDADRIMRLDSPWTQDPADAELQAEFLVDKLSDIRQHPTIKIENRPSLQFAPDLYADLIWLQSDTLAINRLFRVGKIEHSWQAGRACVTAFRLEPYLAYGADIELDEDVLYAFDCPEAGWVYTGIPSDWSCSIDRLLGDLEDATGHQAFVTSLSIELGRRYYFSYYYRYQNTDMMADKPYVNLTVSTTESGAIINDDVPFEATELGDYVQVAYDLSAYEGEHVLAIGFTKLGESGDAGAVVEIDNVAIGQRID